MLKVIKSVRELNFGALLEVYRDNPDISGASEGAGKNAENCFRTQQMFYQYLREIFFHDPRSFYAVWDTENGYMAALRVEPYRDGMLIEALETAPEVRGAGIASALLKTLLTECDGLGLKKIYAHVHKNNRISFHVHQKCGFSVIAESAVLVDGSFSSSYYTLLFIVE